jgi:glyoxylase-like metal-dependent hydrolase (beta-lactamase superfamily II)
MGEAEQIIPGVYLVAGPNISHAEDATSFVIKFADELVMIDSGLGRSVPVILENIHSIGLDPQQISTLILTHCHIDHIGGAREIKEQTGCRIAIHELDADAVETGDASKTAAGWYGRKLSPVSVDIRLSGDRESLSFGPETLHCVHTPGHTPGSISVYLDRGGQRVLFGQDIHGPFHPSFGSDVAMWAQSMQKLLALEADILCEGHFGIFRPKDMVKKYILRYLKDYEVFPP